MNITESRSNIENNYDISILFRIILISLSFVLILDRSFSYPNYPKEYLQIRSNKSINLHYKLHQYSLLVKKYSKTDLIKPCKNRKNFEKCLGIGWYLITNFGNCKRLYMINIIYILQLSSLICRLHTIQITFYCRMTKLFIF